MIYLNIDVTKVNTILTIVSIVVTVISIGCTISSVIVLFRTKKIKNNMMEKLNSYDLISYIKQVNSLYLKLSNQTLPIQWTNVTAESVIILLKEIGVELRKINEHKEKLPESTYKLIKTEIDAALDVINKFLAEINEELSNQYHHLHNFPQRRDALLGHLNAVDEFLQSIRSEWMSK